MTITSSQTGGFTSAPFLLRRRSRFVQSLFRSFGNRRQVAAYGGLAPSPWQSGNVERDQGISKSGNRRLRKTMIELAWFWLRHQPDSALSRWFQARVGALEGTPAGDQRFAYIKYDDK